MQHTSPHADRPAESAAPASVAQTAHGQFPPVSVVMPVLNEATHLEASVRGVLDQHYPGAMEIVLAVGPSNDGTRAVADRLAAADARLRVIDNPTGTTPDALNLAIAASSHDIIVRVDAHGELGAGYIATAVELLQRTGAANVGGLMAAEGRTPFERAVAVAYTSRLGLGGGSFHLADSAEGPADTVFLGVFRREALERVGGYDPSLLRAQDWDLNYRLRKAGETVWFSPRLRVAYRPRSTVRALAQQFFRTGQWRREVMRRNPDTASPRYLAPPVAVTGVVVGGITGAVGLLTGRRRLAVGLAAPLGYLALVTAGSLGLRREMEPQVRARLPLVLAVMHMSWGSGFLVGLPDGAREGEVPDQL